MAKLLVQNDEQKGAEAIASYPVTIFGPRVIFLSLSNCDICLQPIALGSNGSKKFAIRIALTRVINPDNITIREERIEEEFRIAGNDGKRALKNAELGALDQGSTSSKEEAERMLRELGVQLRNHEYCAGLLVQMGFEKRPAVNCGVQEIQFV